MNEERTGCGNCGAVFDFEPAFKWLGETTSRLTCPSCGSFTLNKVHAIDEKGVPVHGEFLVVKTSNHIQKN